MSNYFKAKTSKDLSNEIELKIFWLKFEKSIPVTNSVWCLKILIGKEYLISHKLIFISYPHEHKIFSLKGENCNCLTANLCPVNIEIGIF